ncbi:MAG: hypothetical protein KDK70_01125 [Myxococcales bacterium]|nr:hypothetical protein [Myxococcales bacterium]
MEVEGGGSVAEREAPISVPRLWSAEALRGWVTPLAIPGVPPTLRTPEEYYAAPIDSYRTYPVYHPDWEPPDYLEWIEAQGPQPLIEPARLHTRADWIAAGQAVFEQLDIAASRNTDARAVAFLHDREAIAQSNTTVTADGIIPSFRWVVDASGEVKLTRGECTMCHLRVMEDGSTVPGAPGNLRGGGLAVEAVLRTLAGGFQERGIELAEFDYVAFAVPWIDDDVHENLRGMSESEVFELNRSIIPGTFARFNGSPYYITKIPDIRGIRERHFFDATGEFRNRSPADLARYAVWVSGVEDGRFGRYEVLTAEQRHMRSRPPDEALYALALYLYSLDPLPSPHPLDARARRGEEIFTAEGCDVCHTPPLYTNNKLLAVEGFVPPAGRELPTANEVMSATIDTDPGLALETRKGTGYYKVPSLRGVWYRGLFGHSGFVASLSDWFDPLRLHEDYVPSGWKGPGVTHRAVPGHSYGLDLSAEDRAALVAFLLTL